MGGAGAQAGHQRAPSHDHEREDDQRGRLAPNPAVAAPDIRPAKLQYQPDGIKIERDREQQMGGQPVVADRRAVDQARGDHGPAQRALQSAQDQQREQAWLQPG